MRHWLESKFELSRGGQAHNVRPMEGLRGIAVALVFLVHYVSVWDPWLDASSLTGAFAAALHTLGQAGVDLFFVLSGYLIYGSLLERAQPIGRFLLRRVQRIYPAFLVVFTIYLGVGLALPELSRLPAMGEGRAVFLMENLLLLPGLFVQSTPLLSVAWTLSYEMFYYLTIPLIIIAFDLRSRDRHWRSWLFLSFTALIILDGMVFKGPVRLMMFLAGVLLHEALASPPAWRAPGQRWALFFLLLGLGELLIPVPGALPYVLKICGLFGAFFGLCFTLFQAPVTGSSRVFCATPLRWLGNMSYSYYLLHSLSLRAAMVIIAHVLPVSAHAAVLFWVLIAPVFCLTLVPAAILFVGIERPFSLKVSANRPQAACQRTCGCP